MWKDKILKKKLIVEQPKDLECPECNKKGHIDKVIQHRTNWPHGKKSTPTFTPKIIKYFCHYIRYVNGKIVYKCDFKAKIRLNHREYNWVE